MKAMFLGIRQEKWTNKGSGETGIAHYVAFTTDEHPNAEIRVEKSVYSDFEALTKLQPINLEFDLLKGQYGRFAIVLKGFAKQGSKLNGAA